jgi:hypothetical protein
VGLGAAKVSTDGKDQAARPVIETALRLLEEVGLDGVEFLENSRKQPTGVAAV